MEHYEARINPLAFVLDAAAVAPLGGLLGLRTAYLVARVIQARPVAPANEAVRRRTPAWCALATMLALMAAAAGDGWPLLNAPFPQADTAGKASETGLQIEAIATNHAVSEPFPQIEEIGGFGPDPLSEHQDGRALDIYVPANPGSGEGIALGDGIRDFMLTHATELGIDHLIWRQHLYHPSGTSEPMEDRGGPTVNHFDHLHVATLGGGYPTEGQPRP